MASRGLPLFLTVTLVLVFATPSLAQGGAIYFNEPSVLLPRQLRLRTSVRQTSFTFDSLTVDLSYTRNLLTAATNVDGGNGVVSCVTTRQDARRQIPAAYNCFFSNYRLFILLARLCSQRPATRRACKQAQSSCPQPGTPGYASCYFRTIRPTCVQFEYSYYACVLLRRLIQNRSRFCPDLNSLTSIARKSCATASVTRAVSLPATARQVSELGRVPPLFTRRNVLAPRALSDTLTIAAATEYIAVLQEIIPIIAAALGELTPSSTPIVVS